MIRESKKCRTETNKRNKGYKRKRVNWEIRMKKEHLEEGK
jgi:hypothetical protein